MKGLDKVYIDGENFLHRVSDILRKSKVIKHKREITKFDFKHLFETVLSQKNLALKYYGTKIKNPTVNNDLKDKLQEIINSQRQLKRSLETQGIEFINCGLLKIRDKIICDKCRRCDKCRHQNQLLQEKGVDVKIAVDLATKHKKDDHIYLASSDTDLLPAIEKIRQREVLVTYIGFPALIVASMSRAANKTVVIREKEVLDSYQRLNPTRLLN